jgi:dTMP kinase
VPFVTLEGIEGCGKSTQARALARALGPDALLTHEPGGTSLGRDIRQLLLHGGAMAPETEVLLYFADRAQHVAAVVRPALEAGRVVVCDRYVDSSYAYQSYGRGLSLEQLEHVFRLATGGLVPDLTLLIDVTVELGLGRVGRRGAHDRLEAEERAFHERVRAGYHALASREPRRWLTFDGSKDEAQLTPELLQAVERRLGVRAGGVR